MCKHCGKVVSLFRDTGAPTICCGEQMEEIKA
ncbi:MAG: desulfoferrodoxin, partial [Eubacteriales bacterium]|nr:desulfoferrodoxin [Eubacteriales bacterium]